MAEKLRVGDVVERHLRDNEYVLSVVEERMGADEFARAASSCSTGSQVSTSFRFSRIGSRSALGGRFVSTSVSARRESSAALDAAYMTLTSLRYSYNADFDGDEMNLR